jgi:DNA-binding GntR family transcriptional regulator
MKPTDSKAADDAAFIAELKDEYARVQAGKKMTKRAALRISIVRLLARGARMPGDKLPSETSLTRDLGLSLGTVQSAYSQLREIGMVVRRRGDGTRVAERRETRGKIRHFRIPAPGGGYHAARQEENLIEPETAAGPWQEFLGNPAACTAVRRHLIHGAAGGQDIEVFADLYFDTALAPGLAGTPAEELKFTNIRPILEESAGVKVARLTNRVRLRQMDGKSSAGGALPPAGSYFEITVKATSTLEAPVYFLRWLMDAESGELEFEDIVL